MNRVKMNARHEYEYIANYKIMQNIFKSHKIEKVRFFSPSHPRAKKPVPRAVADYMRKSKADTRGETRKMQNAVRFRATQRTRPRNNLASCH